jgi:hypothetical protein
MKHDEAACQLQLQELKKEIIKVKIVEELSFGRAKKNYCMALKASTKLDFL